MRDQSTIKTEKVWKSFEKMLNKAGRKDIKALACVFSDDESRCTIGSSGDIPARDMVGAIAGVIVYLAKTPEERERLRELFLKIYDQICQEVQD